MVSAASVGYSGTDTWPAIQIAQSLISQWAQFFDRMAMRLPGGKPKDCRCAAMRRVSSITSRQFIVRSTPAPMGWVKTRCCGALFSQW